MKKNKIMFSGKKTLLALGIGGLILSGCGTAIKNVNAYKKDILKPTKFMPSKDILSGKSLPKVIIMDLDDSSSKTARQASLGKSMAGDIDSQLTKGKSADILKRVKKTNITEELKLAELSDAMGGDELNSANYIIGGKINSSSFKHEFVAKKGYYSKNGYVSVPAKFFYTAEVKGQVKIYQLPSLKVVGSFDFDDNKQRTEQAPTSFFGFGKTDTSHKVTRDDGMIRGAGSDAVNSLRLPLKNFFARKGYIFEKRSKDDDVIVKVSLGSKNGAKEGEKVFFYTQEESGNPLTGETYLETIKIAEGVISDQVRPETSWIIIKEVYSGKELRAGDYMKIEYEKEVGDYLNDAGKAINSSGLMKYKDTAIQILQTR
ncbi:MAG: hypothetical protein OIF32_08440 [Campylobacterales bacterium]|nr:hypothetical protein [Campylobacterales bacterium]